jgi:hypothetical protein
MKAGKITAHCTDCCCSEAWHALGIKEYTGRGIIEHIVELKQINSEMYVAAKAILEKESELTTGVAYLEYRGLESCILKIERSNGK